MEKTIKPLGWKEFLGLKKAEFSDEEVMKIFTSRFSEAELDEMTASDAESVLTQLVKQAREGASSAPFPVTISK